MARNYCGDTCNFTTLILAHDESPSVIVTRSNLFVCLVLSRGFAVLFY